MRIILFLVGAAILGISSSDDIQKPCRVHEDNTTYCLNLELNYDEPAKVDQTTNVVSINFAHGSINSKTLTPFQNTEVLSFYTCDINRIEDGALCSLPNLKELHITHSNNFPIITKGTLRGCHKIQKFETHSSFEADALEEMPNLEDLELNELVTANFTKAYLEPLKHLKTLSIQVGDLSKVMEPGLFCSSPVLEDLKVHFTKSMTLTGSLFNDCNSVRKLFIAGPDVVVDGNILSKMSNLEELMLDQFPLKHITKEFLTGFPNLKAFKFVVGEPKIDVDAFENLSHLTSLDFSETHLHDSDLEALLPLSELVTLHLPLNNIENPESLPYLPSLEQLYLNRNSIKKFSLDNLKKKTPKLKILDLTGNPTLPEFEEELEKEDTIRVIYGPALIPA